MTNKPDRKLTFKLIPPVEETVMEVQTFQHSVVSGEPVRFIVVRGDLHPDDLLAVKRSLLGRVPEGTPLLNLPEGMTFEVYEEDKPEKPLIELVGGGDA